MPLSQLLTELSLQTKQLIIMGDFNQNIQSEQKCEIEYFLETFGYKQCINKSTAEYGTTIDHIYCKYNLSLSTTIIPTYYSYHEAIGIYLPENT